MLWLSLIGQAQVDSLVVFGLCRCRCACAFSAAAACCCCVRVCVEIKICCADARAQHPRPQLRHSDSTAERETMAGPEVRRRRFSTMAKTTMFATAVLVASASGVSAFVVDPGGGTLLRSGVANPRSLAGRRRGRFQEGFGARERLPGRRGRTGCCGRLVSRCICCLLCCVDVLGFLTLRVRTYECEYLEYHTYELEPRVEQASGGSFAFRGGEVALVGSGRVGTPKTCRVFSEMVLAVKPPPP